MKLADITRRILHPIIQVHRRAVTAQCEAKARHAAALSKAVEQQELLISVEQQRLRDLWRDVAMAESDVDAAWDEAIAELGELPLTPYQSRTQKGQA